MKKFILKIFFLIVVTSVIFSFTEKVFTPKSYTQNAVKTYENIESIDVAIFGSSHALQSYDPRVFETELGANSFNFGGPAQRLEVTNVVADRVLKEHKIKLAIIDIFAMSLTGYGNENARNIQLRTLDYLPLSKIKLEVLDTIFGDDKMLYSLSKTFRNHTKWSVLEELNFTENFFLGKDDDFYKGFKSSSYKFNDKTWKTFLKKYKKKTKKNTYKTLGLKRQEQINKTIELFQKNNVQILFVNAPSYVTDYSEVYKSFSKNIKNYIESKGFHFIDFNELRDSLKLKRVHFRDPNHLNPKGALEVSKYLTNYIRTNFKTIDFGNKPLNLSNNRYAHVKNNYKSVLFTKKIEKKDLKKAQGVKQIHLNKISDNRYEVLFEWSKKAKNNMHLKLVCKLNKKQLSTVPLDYIKELNEDKLILMDRLEGEDLLKYDGKYFRYFQFNYPYNEISSLDLFIGKKRDFKALSIKNNKLK